MAAVILNVNDDEAGRYALTRVLRAAAFEVDEASSGAEALEKVRRRPALVLLDVHLPDLDGNEVSRRIKADPALRSTPILQISALRISPRSLAQGLESGADAYLTQPVEPEVLIATVRSLLRLAEAQREAARAASRWEATFNAIPDPVFLLDPGGGLVQANAAGQALLGAGAGAGTRVLDRLARGGTVPDALRALVAAPAHDHAVELSLDGHTYRGSAAPVPASGGEPPAIVLTLTNVSERVARERAELARDAAVEADEEKRRIVHRLEESERRLHDQARLLERSNADLEQFAYAASHDLQEPLRMISGFTQLLERRYRGQLDPSADEYIAFVVDGVTRMQRLISDLLTYSRVGRDGTRGEVDLEKLLAEVTQDLRGALAEANATLTHDPLPRVRGDAQGLRHVLLNLLSNGIKFRGQEPPRIHVGARQEDAAWHLWVKDNGIGIDPAHFSRLFILFQRLHGRAEYGGTGIGLALAKKVVDRHGGRIWIDSAPGQGATFHFTLPLQPTE